MRVRLVKESRHPRAEITCPPLRWRTVGRKMLFATVLSVSAGVGGAFAYLYASAPLLAVASVIVSVASALWLSHLLNAARAPVTFKVANGELYVTRPFLFMRRRRRIRTTDVRDVTVSPRGRLSIRRRYKLPLRVRG